MEQVKRAADYHEAEDVVPQAEQGLALIGRVARGDRLALTELYELYRLPLFRYLLHITADCGLAEELLQDTFVAAWKGAHRFEGRASARTWLLAIARRQAHNVLRQRGVLLAELREAVDLPASDPEPEAVLLANATRLELLAAIDRLAFLHREVLLLIFVEELSYQECADALHVPVGTIKSRLSNAKRALRNLLIVRGQEDHDDQREMTSTADPWASGPESIAEPVSAYPSQVVTVA